MNKIIIIQSQNDSMRSSFNPSVLRFINSSWKDKDRCVNKIFWLVILFRYLNVTVNWGCQNCEVKMISFEELVIW